jgi:predicted nucleic acid-binding protein
MYGRIQDRPIISIQVLNEFAAILIKHAIPGDTIYQAIKELIEDSAVIELDLEILWETWRIRNKYFFSYWDSMIIAAALKAECHILYSEDFQNEQIIENRLKIINPFFETDTKSPR